MKQKTSFSPDSVLHSVAYAKWALFQMQYDVFYNCILCVSYDVDSAHFFRFFLFQHNNCAHQKQRPARVWTASTGCCIGSQNKAQCRTRSTGTSGMKRHRGNIGCFGMSRVMSSSGSHLQTNNSSNRSGGEGRKPQRAPSLWLWIK